MIKRWQIKKPACGTRVARMAVRVSLAMIIALISVGSLSAGVRAAPNPVDLELGGEGAAPWSITDIVPGDNGTQLVELRNIGTRDGFVTIWISDVISSEGLNPGSETGNIAEPGELNSHLLFNISSNRSSTPLNLPATIDTLPQSISDPNSIEILPLKAGDIVDLIWDWSLPQGTANDVQGDGISFTLTYLLTELEITDVSGVVEGGTGTFTDNVTIESEPGGSAVSISQGTVGETKDGDPLSEMWFLKIEKDSTAPLEDTVSVGAQYDAGPHGSTFDSPVTITLNYDINALPERAQEGGLAVATWDEDTGEWVKLGGSVVDAVTKTVSAPITHFSRYTLLVFVPPPPPPEPEEDEGETPPPDVPDIIDEKEKEIAPPVLRANILGDERTVEIEADGTLRESLSLTDPDGRFVIEIDSGSRIISSDGEPITRMEVTEAGESLALPGNAVALSPIYKITGYISESLVPVIIFEPSARLTILYDTRDLPENAFPPYITNYTEAGGWVQLETPPDSFFEIGKAKALIHHASWFAAVTELAMPPPPLPAEFIVSDLTISPERSRLGQPVMINLTITNNGAVSGSYELYLIIDGIVRAVKEVTLAGQSVETVSFEVSNLAAGKHQVKIAGLTGEFQILKATVAFPDEATLGWVITEVSIGVVVVTLLISLFLIIRKSRRVQTSQYDPDTITSVLRHKDEEQSLSDRPEGEE